MRKYNYVVSCFDRREAMPGRSQIDWFGRYMRAIYSQIKVHARNGKNFLMVKSLYYPSKMKQVIDILRDDGYSVDYNCLEDEFIIRW